MPSIEGLFIRLNALSDVEHPVRFLHELEKANEAHALVDLVYELVAGDVKRGHGAGAGVDIEPAEALCSRYHLAYRVKGPALQILLYLFPEELGLSLYHRVVGVALHKAP